MGTWTNNDGLILTFGPDEAEKGYVGAENNTDVTETFEIRLTYNDLPAVGSTKVLSHNLNLPAGAVIESVEVYTSDTSTSATGTLDFSLLKSDLTTSLLAIASGVAAASAGAKTSANVNSSIAEDGYFAVTTNTEAFTTGEWVVKVNVVRT